MSKLPPLPPSGRPPTVDEIFAVAAKLQQQDRPADAKKLYDRVLRVRPNHIGALQNTGVLAMRAGRPKDAERLFRQALAAGGDSATLHLNLGSALHLLRRYEAAHDSFDHALALDPRVADAWSARSELRFDIGDVEGALQDATQATNFAPSRVDLRFSRLKVELYMSGSDAAAMARDVTAAMESTTREVRPRTGMTAPDPERTIQLGLVSADFKDHPVGRFLLGLAEHIDQSRIELHGFSSTERRDGTTERLRNAFAHWHEVTMLDDEALAERIRQTSIDVLVDLSGHTKGDRLKVFARRPAPVSFTWLGYFATTGVRAIDYVLGNDWVLPAGEEGQWTEAPWRMPDTYLCYDVPRAGVVAALPALQTGRVTFGSFNNFHKISTATVSAWSALLVAVPGSRLILRSSRKMPPEFTATLRRKFEAAGLVPERLRIDEPQTDYAAHLRGYNEIDIALDTFPYNGGTTTVEALYMGVPVLVKAGDRYVAHMGESILHNAGLVDWIAPDEGSFVRLGVQKASDVEALAELREGLRPRMLQSPLFDAPRFARNFEEAVRGMWQAWCASR